VSHSPAAGTSSGPAGRTGPARPAPDHVDVAATLLGRAGEQPGGFRRGRSHHASLL